MEGGEFRVSYSVGVFPGKFSPPHRGHLASILEASCRCEKLYVVVSHNEKLEQSMYDGTPTKPITLKQKLKWLSVELSEFDHIRVVGLDEKDIPVYPYGWKQWCELLNESVKEPFEVIFGGEPQYADEGYTKYFPDTIYAVYERTQSGYPISATEIRVNPYKHWDYILGAAREHFVKRVLISGTESCGKTTMTKMLAKIFHTSWAREEGRFYSTKYFGGNEDVFEVDDFLKICWEQREIEDHAVKTANQITFFDTDAVVTQFYCNMYLGEHNPKIETFVDPTLYDKVLFLTPSVKWVSDGFRWNDNDSVRWNLHEELKEMYRERGFGDKLVVIYGNSYRKRLKDAIEESRALIGGGDE